MSNRLDILSKMYEEHAKQARQHEDQRERMTSMILVIAAALIAFISHEGLTWDSLPVSVTIIILGGYGSVFSLKHYERNRHHTSVLREFRDELDNELKKEVNTPTQQAQKPIGSISRAGGKNHKERFHIHFFWQNLVQHRE